MVSSRGIRSVVLASVAALVVMAAAGCGGSGATPHVIFISPPPGTLAPGATPTPSPPPPAITGEIIATTAPDSRWTVTFKKPVIGGVSPAVATKMNAAITAKVNGYIGAFTSRALPAAGSGSGPSTLDGNYTIALNSSTLVSLRLSVLTAVTGESSVGEAGSINFAVSTGATIALSDVFTNPAAALPTITAKTRGSLSGALGSDLAWPGGTVPMTFFDKAWTFTPSGLEFMWSQGAIAGASAGMPSAVVAWADIKSAINPKGPAAEFAR
ncbi:MAG TPA: hypothetical protein VF349_09105 [Candidatus Limnocylindrales bacterium]